ncbi:MAG: DUF1273 domain-containing protein [Ruminococcaceae bacterium]|nr:DUF1273 domain-containing protein [Oscillospiraceae bacterium]
MATCTFFGHKDTPTQIKPLLKAVLVDLIENKNVDTFYIGNQGNFDLMARDVAENLTKEYPHIRYFVILAYFPVKQCEFKDNSNTIYPDGLEKTPPKFAILKRNEWLLKHSDHVVTYVKHTISSAASFAELAKKKGKSVINIANIGNYPADR